VLHGEAGDANREGIQLARANLRLLLEGYTAEDTYNQDETGILWRQQPTRTLAIGKKAGLKKEKERVTVSLMCNAAGSDKRLFLFDLESEAPEVNSKQFSAKARPQHPIMLSWMTAKEYSEYIKELNSEMKRCAC
jgi:hypothetical protein